MDPIKDWFNSGKDFYAGVALYEVYGDNKDLIEVFAQGYSEYRQDRLEKALKCIIPELNVSIIKTVNEPIVLLERLELPELKNPNGNDPYKEQWMPHYQQMNYLRHHLLDPDLTDEKRGEMAYSILELEKKCIRIWEKRDVENITGHKIIEENITETDEVTDKNMLRQTLNNLRSSRSKMRGKLKLNPLDIKAKDKLDILNPQILAIEIKLGISPSV